MKTCGKCGAHFRIWVVIEGKKRSLSKRRYCLECSPFGHHRTRHPDHETLPAEKNCKMCGETKQKNEFYHRRNGTGLTPYCIKCTMEDITKRQKQLKEQAVVYKGGACYVCGYNACPSAMDFHHMDPNKKDFSISQARKTSFNWIKEELDKCILLCARCHREVECGFTVIYTPPPT